jgi:hypothetical protein
MGSDWVYYTNIRPRRKRSEGEDGNNEYRTEFKKAFDNFLEDCKIPISDLQDCLENNDIYNYEITTDPENDPINKDSSYHVRFMKSRFLSNPKFKRGLIEYYNPVGYFVRGPSKVDDNKWVIEFSQKIGY